MLSYGIYHLIGSYCLVFDVIIRYNFPLLTLTPSLREANTRYEIVRLIHFKTSQIHLILGTKILADCQTAWIRVRRRVTRRLIRIQAVCI